MFKHNDKKVFCTYCGKWFPASTMTPMTEKRKKYVHYYCERCLPDVRGNIRSLPWADLFVIGEKGQILD